MLYTQVIFRIFLFHLQRHNFNHKEKLKIMIKGGSFCSGWLFYFCNVKGFNFNFNLLGDENLIDDARLSFPSEHSSLVSYAMLFLIIYLEARLFTLRFRACKHSKLIIFSLRTLPTKN